MCQVNILCFGLFREHNLTYRPQKDSVLVQNRPFGLNWTQYFFVTRQSCWVSRASQKNALDIYKHFIPHQVINLHKKTKISIQSFLDPKRTQFQSKTDLLAKIGPKIFFVARQSCGVSRALQKNALDIYNHFIP